MREDDMKTIAGFIARALEAPADASHLAKVKTEVERFTAEFPLHQGVEEILARS
jgi:glycine/serine hydroxymethyltransferase